MDSNETKTRLIGKLAEILEAQPEQLADTCDFRRDVSDWDSLKGFAIIVMLQEEFNAVLEVEQFIRCRTVGDICKILNLATETLTTD